MELSKKQFITSLILKSILIISVIIGVIVSATSESEFMSGNMIFMYFTIQSNILIAIVCLIGLIFLLKNFKANRIWYVIKLVSTISITLTGLVFTFMLAPTLGSQAWNLANILTHVIVPVSAVVDFFVVGINMYFKKKDVIYVIIPPLLYAIYAGIGYKLDWKFTTEYNYPYFFLNWGSEAGAFGFSNELPFIGVMYWIILLLLLLIGLGFLYLKIINVFKKKYKIEA
ncbi:MAG: Pr6Pr family membrane protein [Acholeplasmatales bacterium]|nr:Pr6Pr family membrane protein [Acholeplasmatales bacterium]